MEKVNKKYALNNSYFKNKASNDPDDIVDIIYYWKEFGELPFDYCGDNWVYDAFCERQKRKGVEYSQYLTPDVTAKQLVALTDNFAPKDMQVLNACCGLGQLSKHLIEKGFKVSGFDIDRDMVESCKLLYTDSTFYQYDFKETGSVDKWELIVSNPPFESKELPLFLEWLSNTLTADGRAILLLPTAYLEKTNPKTLQKILSRFKSQHQELVSETFMHSSLKAEIFILELSEAYKLELFGNRETNNKQRKILMETKDLEAVQQIALDKITLNPLNPRKQLKQDEIDELAQSVQSIGLLQAITLRKVDDSYQIVCGERRFRAFLQNKETTIPAIIKVLTNDQVMEMALAENLNRKDLSPIEEANGFQYFIGTGRYTLEDLIATFGKSEAYIRSRLRLLNLTTEFQELLAVEELSISMGLELAKYSKTIQSEVYAEHFVHDDNSNWKDLGTKDFAGRLQRIYTMDLSNYSFDKTACATCPSNSETYSLFPDSSGGRCTNSECLKQKRSQYTLDYCKIQTDSNPSLTICISPYDKINEDIGNKLSEEGLEVQTALAQDYPEAPIKPFSSSYNSLEEYQESLEEYQIEEMSYYAELDEIEKNIKEGKCRKYIYIGDNNPKYCYAKVEATNDTDQLSELKEQDLRNKDNAIKNICKDVLVILGSKILPSTDMSLFEDELFIYILLSSLSQKSFSQFGIADESKTFLSDYDKEYIIKGLSQAQRALLYREFIVKYFASVSIFSSKNKIAFMIPEFAKRHFPEELAEIQKKHIGNYEKASVKIKSRIEQLKEVPETIMA